MTSRYVFAARDADEVLTSVDEISNEFPLDLEVNAIAARDQDGFAETTLAITLDALCESEADARKACSLVHNLPVARKALKQEAFVSCQVRDLLKRFEDILDNRGRRYEANNLWTDTPVYKLMPNLQRILETMPPAPSRMLIMWWVPKTPRPDMAFSLEANLYIALYGIGVDPAHDDKHAKFVVSSLKNMEPHRKGIQLADENLPAHPGKFMKIQNFKRLEDLRAKYDPKSRFNRYMRLPPEFENIPML